MWAVVSRNAPVARASHLGPALTAAGSFGFVIRLAPAELTETPPAETQAPAATAAAPGAAGVSMQQAVRLITPVAWLGWVDWLYQVGAGLVIAPLFAVAITGGALAALTAAVVVRGEEGGRRLDLLLMAGTITLFVSVALTAAAKLPYLTDELAFDQAGAAALLHGTNPYALNLLPSLKAFGVSGATQTLQGSVVSSISYPSMSLLLYAPFVALFGAQSYAGVTADVAAWVVAGVLLWRFAGAGSKTWVPLFLALPTLAVLVAGGVTDSLYVPFLLTALYRWDRFGDPAERSMARWAGPLGLGLACAVKQTPWLLAPFLLAGVGLEARSRGWEWARIVARYGAFAAAAFLAPNLPFIVIDPGSWLRGIALPFAGGLVPLGSGLVSVLRVLHIGGGNLALFSAAALSALVAGVGLYVLRYRVLKAAAPLLAVAPLFLGTRSLTSYFAFAVPALIVSMCTTASPPKSANFPRIYSYMLKGLTAMTATACALAVGAAFAAAPPLGLTVRVMRESGTSFTTVLRVTNTSSGRVAPHFAITQTDTPRQLLEVVSGPSWVAAGATAVYTLAGPVEPTTPKQGEAYQIEAFTSSPAAMSASLVMTVPHSS